MKLQFLFAMTLCWSLAQSSARASTELDEACLLYSKHDYGSALKKLDALPASQHCARSEYYRALTLQALHRFPEAKLSFEKVATQKKDASLSQLARQGLAGLSRVQLRNVGTGMKFAASAGTQSMSQPLPQSVPASSNSGTGKYLTDSKWKIASPGEGGEGVDHHGLPADWTFVKTRKECH